MSSSPATTLLLVLLVGWAAIAWRATAALARRRGLTFLAAGLDPRGWTAEPVAGVRAWILLLAWPVLSVAIALAR